jgi:hypothetical protein
MSFRSMLGLCEHKWHPTGNMIATKVVRVVDSKEFTTGFIDVRECERCGQTRGFQL